MELHEQTDAQLVALLQTDPDAALTELMRRYKHPIVNFSYRLLGRAEDAEEVGQEVFVRCYRHRQGIRADAKLSTWLFALARNACLDRLRYRQRHPSEPLETAPEPATEPAEVENRELGRQIAAAIAALPEDQRTAVVLIEYHGLSYTEAAEVMDCSVKSVESRLYRARADLRKRLAGLLTDFNR